MTRLLSQHADYFSDGILIDQPSEKWLRDYKNFTFAGDPGLLCPLTGRFFFHETTMGNLQHLRTRAGRSISVNSGHRSRLYNASLPGAASDSCHMFIALDIQLTGTKVIDYRTARIALECGFTGIGLARGFLHLDMSRPRWWSYGDTAQRHWQPFINKYLIRK